jgi:hypothetical protein
MMKLTAYERRIRQALIAAARRADPIDTDTALVTYGELDTLVPSDHTGNSKPGVGHAWMTPVRIALYHVSAYEHQFGRPLISALAVRKDGRFPGEGFAKLVAQIWPDQTHDDQAFWEDHVRAVVEFWTDEDPYRVHDAALTALLRELSDIKTRLRALEKKTR